MLANPIYTIVYLCPLDIQQQINWLKDELGIETTTATPNTTNIILKDHSHFAIKRSFTLKPGYSESMLLSHLNGIQIPSVQISCRHTSTFAKSNYGAMVFLEMEKNTSVLNLHQKIKELIDGHVNTKNPEHEGEDWIPHITFTYNTPPNLLEKYSQTIQSRLLPLNFTFNKIYLLREENMELDERSIIKIYE